MRDLHLPEKFVEWKEVKLVIDIVLLNKKIKMYWMY